MNFLQYFITTTVQQFLDELNIILHELKSMRGHIGGRTKHIFRGGELVEAGKHKDVHDAIKLILNKFFIEKQLPFRVWTWSIGFELPTKLEKSIVYSTIAYMSAYYSIFDYTIKWKKVDKRYKWGHFGILDSVEVKISDKLIESIERTCTKRKDDILTMDLQEFFINVALDEQTRRFENSYENMMEAERELEEKREHHMKNISIRKEIQDIRSSGKLSEILSATDER